MTPLSRRSSLALLATCAAALAALCTPAIAPAAEGQIIVRYEPGADAQDRAEARGDAEVVRDEPLPLTRTELVTPEPGTSVAEAVAELEGSGEVLSAEPDSRRTAMKTANDAEFGTLWGLTKIAAPAAWDTTTGSPDVTVAVVDTGIDLNHPDLVPNLWHNTDDVAGNGIDDDANGFVDDVDGWDFVGAGTRTNSPEDANPTDVAGHGTHVAGTIAANGDGAGVVGVTWDTTVMPVRVLDGNGSGYTSDIIKGYDYAARNGAKIINLSLGGPTSDAAEYAKIAELSDVLFVTAAGNGGEDGAGDDNDFADDDPRNDDYEESFPCEYNLPNVVCVAASTRWDQLSRYSNYGAQTVDIAAPGDGIRSTILGGGWGYMSGTSMATPHVAGAAALLLANDQSLAPWQIARMLTGSADPVPALAGKVASGGRLNVARALDAEPPAAALEPAITPQPAQPMVARTVAQPAPAPVVTPQPAPATPGPSSSPVATAPKAPTPSTPVRIADRTAPALALSLPTRLVLRTVLTRGLRVPATCSERCTARVEITIDGRTAKRLRLSTRATKVRVAGGTATLARGATRSVTVRFTARAKRALRRTRSVRVAVRVTATDAAGNARTRARSVTLGR
jgi:subtilisin family serine protease